MTLGAELLLVEVKYTNYIDLLPEKYHLNAPEAFIDKRLRLNQVNVRKMTKCPVSAAERSR